MSTPNSKDPNPKKPTPPATPPAAKKPVDGAKPAAPKPPAKPNAVGGKPQPGAKPAAKGDKKPIKREREKSWTAESGGRKIGQVMVDLGFIDESQLWDILEEARTNGVRVGQT